jgi:hypothetical protein
MLLKDFPEDAQLGCRERVLCSALFFVLTALVAVIHDLTVSAVVRRKSWMAGTGPAMTWGTLGHRGKSCQQVNPAKGADVSHTYTLHPAPYTLNPFIHTLHR